jgi:hypothetical protein
MMRAMIATVILMVPRLVLAQAAPEELARRLVGEGIEAAKSRDWITARTRFARAYEIQPLPLTLYNLAAAQEKTGQFVEADRSYRIFLRETTEGEHVDFRKAATERRIELRNKIAFLVIKAQGMAPQDVLRIGELEIAQAVLGESLPTNPGAVDVQVIRNGEVIASQNVRLQEGDSRLVTLEVPPPAEAPPPTVAATAPPPAALTATAQTEPEEESGGLLSSPVFWVIVAGVALAGAGVGVYFGTRPDSPYDSSLESVRIVGR